ncbi:UNVERIFIED_CONTAM: hypothetical protein FKN15_055434 [Acipenser sinensis]
MLQVLLRITDAVMRRPQENTKDVFATSLAGMLFRTIIVAWVRASLSVLIARELWDELLSVLSSLTAWEELVIEWANIMDSLTGVVARSVYGLDMSSLPLDRLSEQKEKKQRGRAKRSQSISNCVHLYEALPVAKSVPLLLHTVSSFLPGISYNSSSHRLSGESVSSETSNGCLNETDACLMTWQAFEEEPDSLSPADVTIDSDSPRNLLQLSPSDGMTDSSECLADDISIIAGGSLTGWHPDSAAVLWRRVLGILGDVNSIQCPKIHAKVFLYLYELWHKLAKIRDNLGISADNQSSPPQPLLIPPLTMFASWLFKATTLPPEYKEGKLHAYRLICEMMTKHQDVLPNSDFLVHFYDAMHKGFISDDQAPRIEAQTILGSLVCFPNLYQQMPLLQPVPGSTERFIGNEDIKDYFVNILLKNARSEPSECARCIAVCSLGVWICEELAQCTSHPHVKDAINVMGVTLKLGNKVVAHVACDVFRLLVCHWQNLQKYEASLPKKITEIFVSTIAFLLPSAEHSTMEVDKKVLHCCVHGSNLYTQQSHYLLSLADLSATDYDPFLPVGNVRNSEPPQSHTSVDFGNLLTVAEEKKRRNMELIPLTARMIMTHLANHLSHHPLSGGPAILHSLISENHDNDYVESSELSSEVFKSPNLQLFVFNDSTLVSYLQIPAEKTGAGEPPGAAADVRVIVRDISGKYSWDGGVLYGPLDGQSSSSCKDQHIKVPWGSARPGQKVHPMSWDSEGNSEEGQDVLDNLLENLGSSSPECLSQQQGKLNDPAPPPLGMSHEQEHTIMEAILRQSSQEEAHVKRWHSDISMKVDSQKEPAPQEPKAPFYFCRLLLNDLGMNSWDRSRETHKIAVFYIGDGQEDKCSILSNTGGSQAYEDFVSGLGWEVSAFLMQFIMGDINVLLFIKMLVPESH